jgi:hypothetical protein
VRLLLALVRCRSCLQSKQRDVASTYVVFDTPTIGTGRWHHENPAVDHAGTCLRGPQLPGPRHWRARLGLITLSALFLQPAGSAGSFAGLLPSAGGGYRCDDRVVTLRRPLPSFGDWPPLAVQLGQQPEMSPLPGQLDINFGVPGGSGNLGGPRGGGP